MILVRIVIAFEQFQISQAGLLEGMAASVNVAECKVHDKAGVRSKTAGGVKVIATAENARNCGDEVPLLVHVKECNGDTPRLRRDGNAVAGGQLS